MTNWLCAVQGSAQTSVCLVRKVREKVEVLRKVRENQGTFSIIWKNLRTPDKIKELLFHLNICVTRTNDWSSYIALCIA